MYWIQGNARDGSDAAVRGWERQITLQELMNTLGDKFDFERDWRQLIIAINYGSGGAYNFNGFIKGGVTYNLVDFNTTGTLQDQNNGTAPEMNYLNFEDCFASTYNYKVYFGFIEWEQYCICLLYTSPSPRDRTRSRMPSSA